MHRDSFLSPGTKEAHVRQALIDPFFEALGWDVRNTAKVAPQYREVVTEDSLEVEGQQRAPDYAFRIGTLTKFYVEAKKCGVNINADPAPAFQLRRYGWSGKTALSILTDFEELAVYDCTLRPRPTDKASAARILYLRQDEYAGRWREVWDIFSREAVWSSAFDKFSASKRKRGTSEVDVEFLREIEGWRDSLARNIALRNHNISSEDLNAAVQRTIDRVVFLRMAEDRGLEPYGRLLKLCEQPGMYSRFMDDLCRRADEKYNSGIFHFQKEPGVSEPPDNVTSRIAVDDKVFRPILQSLYFAHGSPYHFGVLPVEILGTVYERFLGRVIRLTAGHQAKVEEKPEVRKAGGVYYTPAFIVDYVVRNTVGAQIAGKSPAQLAGAKGNAPFRVLDMACGSGSFLLGAYQCLLDHCLKWHMEHKPESSPKAVHRDPRTGQWRLTIEEKKRILTTHIFGVDIDLQAVEVSKLSLLLKALEGEDDASLSMQMMLFHERALPNLAGNIQCGNSLIGPAYFTGDLLPDDGEIRRVNPFDWETAFPDAMKAGGFDCVIGNPPYIRIQTMKEWAPLEVEVYKELYRAAGRGNYDIYVVFIERGLQLLNPSGRLGFICPHKFFNAKYGEPVRALISEGGHLSHVVHFGDQQVFDGATTYTCLLFLEKGAKEYCHYVEVQSLPAWRKLFANGENGDNGALWGIEGTVDAETILPSDWNFHVGHGNTIFEKLSRMPEKLGDVANIFVGTQTSADDVFVLDDCRLVGRRVSGVSRITGKTVLVESGAVVPFLRGRDIRRYSTPQTAMRLICPYVISPDTLQLIGKDEMMKRFPRTWRHLEEHRRMLEMREGGRFKGAAWYAFGYPKSMHLFQQNKIIVPDYNNISSFTYDSSGHFYKTGYGIISLVDHFDHHYLLGLLNSKLLFWYLRRIGTYLRGGYIRFWTQFLEKLPVRRIDVNSSGDKASHDRMVTLVTSMLTLHQRLAAADSEAQRTVVKRQIAATDAEIDRLVYSLYGLTDREIALVEGESGK
ncbi:MAG: Eco57I restriction-modification methylase domain-containing protein [Candidatus Hydrogenedentes bacterium]|nr:Eco57I restriction-modification methylase domain-containing protein [Candidatus Hydrogenedentota bacterium]